MNLASKENVVACTVCSTSYLAQALTMFQSLDRVEPQIQKVIYLADIYEMNETLQLLSESIKIQIITMKDFLEPFILDNYIRLNALEFYTSLKPTIIKHCFKKNNGGTVVYCDTDLFFLNTIKPEVLCRDFGVYLTPHNRDIPDYRSELNLARNGVFNAGFIVIKGQKGFEFINWWEEKCRYFCFQEPEEGIFVDQKWLDLAPAIFSDIYISRCALVNVAYWNINEVAELSYNDIVVLHLSGLDSINFGKGHKFLSRFSETECPAELIGIISDYLSTLRLNEEFFGKFQLCSDLPIIKFSDLQRRYYIHHKQLTLVNGSFVITGRNTCPENLKDLNRTKTLMHAPIVVLGHIFIKLRADRILCHIITGSRILSRKSSWIKKNET